jgi:hypothetical protein
MLLIFLWVSTLFDLILGIAWSKSTFTNVCVKLLLIILGIMGIILLLTQYGFIIQKQ